MLIPATLSWSFGGSYTYGISRIETRNPLTPTSGNAVQNALATAIPFPAFEYTLVRLETGLTYQITKAWSTTLGYIFDSFSKHDWRTDALTPWAPGVPSLFLGSDVRNYTAHIIGMTARYQFR